MGEEPEPAGGEKYKRLIAAAQRQDEDQGRRRAPLRRGLAAWSHRSPQTRVDRADLRRARWRVFRNAAESARLDISPFELVAVGA